VIIDILKKNSTTVIKQKQTLHERLNPYTRLINNPPYLTPEYTKIDPIREINRHIEKELHHYNKAKPNPP